MNRHAEHRAREILSQILSGIIDEYAFTQTGNMTVAREKAREVLLPYTEKIVEELATVLDVAVEVELERNQLRAELAKLKKSGDS